MEFDQFHFGAGRNSVGTVVPLSRAAGGRVHVVVHIASELSPGCELVCSICGPDGRRNDLVLEVASLSRADTIEQLEPSARAVLLSAPELLLTTALSPRGIQAQSEFLITLARARAEAGKLTTFIPCEDEIGEDHTDLLERLSTLGVQIRRSALYRLCSQDPLASSNERRAVRADQHVEWVIEGVADTALLESLAQAPGVTFSEHIDQHILRIRWLASGIRLTLALLGAASNRSQIRLRSVESEHEDWLRRVYPNLVPLVQAHCRDLDCTEEYAERQLQSLLRHEDDGLRHCATCAVRTCGRSCANCSASSVSHGASGSAGTKRCRRS